LPRELLKSCPAVCPYVVKVFQYGAVCSEEFLRRWIIAHESNHEVSAAETLPVSVLCNFPSPDWESKCEEMDMIRDTVLVLVFVVLAAVATRLVR
jgi:hypothetical protein